MNCRVGGRMFERSSRADKDLPTGDLPWWQLRIIRDDEFALVQGKDPLLLRLSLCQEFRYPFLLPVRC